MSVALPPNPPAIVLSGHVRGGSGRHPIDVALWDERGFLVHPLARLRLAPGPTAPAYRFRVPAGRWAISAFEDRNGNGVLDEGLFGPDEPFGFARPFRAWRKPSFDDVAFTARRSIADLDVVLQ